ncbi:septum formation initiator family protein [Candidatus Daviesbacteria bacterium]|nr:septum formation initiator family protein [Candidatus Daviesbacteria bacterium]
MLKKIALGFIVLVILIIAYNLIRQIFEAIKSGERLSQSADVVYQLEVRNRSLKEKLARIQSPEFLEEEIRNRLGFAKPGETVVIIPEEKLKLVLGASSPAQIRYPNWLGWWKVFFK